MILFKKQVRKEEQKKTETAVDYYLVYVINCLRFIKFHKKKKGSESTRCLRYRVTHI